MSKTAYCPECDKITETVTRKIAHEFNIKGTLIEVEGNANLCSQCGQLFGDELYNQLLQKAYDEYRRRNELLSPEDIRRIREKYQLSQVLFSKIAGIGEATLQRYERGALPSVANNKLISLARTPQGLLDLLEANRTRISELDYHAIKSRLEKEVDVLDNPESCILRRLSRTSPLEKGYSAFSFDKLKGMIAAVLKKTGSSISITKMNKLLFFIDFAAFKSNTKAISGMSYVNWQHGPVPEGALSYELYNLLQESGIISIEEIQFDDCIQRWFYLKDPTSTRYLEEKEQKVIDEVMKTIGQKSARELEELSHEEDGCRKTSCGEVISFDYANNLKAIDC